MKLTIFKSPLPVQASPTPSTVVASRDAFEKKLGAMRVATGRPDRFVSLCACAVHDRPFTVVYERTDPARPFLMTGIYKAGEGGGGADMPARAGRSRTLAASEINTSGWRCPHCESNGLNIACGKCGSTICGGRLKAGHGMERVFECRSSCGARGTLEDAQTISGAEAAGKTELALRSAPRKDQTLLPSLNLPRLGRSS